MSRDLRRRGGAALAKGLNNPCPGFMTGSDCRDDYWADEPVDATLIECLAFNAPLAELISLFDEAALDFLIKRFVFIALFLLRRKPVDDETVVACFDCLSKVSAAL